MLTPGRHKDTAVFIVVLTKRTKRNILHENQDTVLRGKYLDVVKSSEKKESLQGWKQPNREVQQLRTSGEISASSKNYHPASWTTSGSWLKLLNNTFSNRQRSSAEVKCYDQLLLLLSVAVVSTTFFFTDECPILPMMHSTTDNLMPCPNIHIASLRSSSRCVLVWRWGNVHLRV